MIQPLAGYVMIKQANAETKTKSGLFLAESTVEKPAEGTIIAIGDAYFSDGREFNSPVSVGDTVIYKKWGADDIKDGSNELKLVRFEDLMAIKRDD